MQGGGASSEGSSCPEAEKLQSGQATVSTPPPQSTGDSPTLEKVPPSAASTATPASEPVSSSFGPAQGGTDSAGTFADDGFSTADEVFSAPDSPHKEFHCAVLRALSKEPSVVEVAEADQAAGTPDEAESSLNSGLVLPSSPAQPRSTSLHTAALGLWESLPAVSSLLFLGVWSLLPLLFIYFF